MGESPPGSRLRVTLRRLQILDKKEPFYERFGEIRVRARVRTRDAGGAETVTEIPERGTLRVSDQPGRNIVTLDVPIFEGWVADHLEVELDASELDRLSRPDLFRPYRRVHTGGPARLIGRYGPGDEGIDPEEVGDWRVWYDIEEV